MNERAMAEAIRHNAKIVEEFLRDNNAPTAYSIDALVWLEHHIEERRNGLTEQEKDNLINLVGAFLGECLCHANRGVWVERDGRWGVQMEDNALVVLLANSCR